MKRVLIVLFAIGACAASSPRLITRRLAAIGDAGTDGPVVWQIVNDAGQPSPVQPPFGDPAVSQLTVTEIRVAPDTCNMVVIVNDGTHNRVVTGAHAGPAVCSGLVTQAKNQAAAQLGIALQ